MRSVGMSPAVRQPGCWNLPFFLTAAFAVGELLIRPGAAPAVDWESLERRGAVIDKVELHLGDVFDLSDPVEDHSLARLANFIHITSRGRTISRELLFRPGDPVQERIVRETERNLRARSFIREARIEPRLGEDGSVAAHVYTEDAWSLKGGFRFKYEGGDVEWGVDAEEVNLFGWGKTLLLGYERTKERTSSRIGFKDPRLIGSRWQLAAGYDDLSDGHRKRFSLRRPFYSIDTSLAALGSVFNEESSIRLYDLGEEIARFPAAFDRGSLGVWKVVARSRRSVFRLGLEYRVDLADYGDPEFLEPDVLPEPNAASRRLQGFLLHGQYFEDRHIVAANMASIGRVEDINLGWDVRTSAGMYAEALGGGEDAFTAALSARKYWRVGEATTVKLRTGAGGRYQDGRWEDSLYEVLLAAFNQRFSHQTLTAAVLFDGGVRLAPENWLYIGASDGLRGYVNEFRAGDRRWIFTAEERVITDWILWGLAQVGFVAFLDAGAIRRFDNGNWSRVYADVGGGVRFGNLKSAFGRVAVATMAFPLVKGEGVNDFEIFVGNEIPF